MSKNSLTTYEDRSRKLDTKARKACFDAIQRDWNVAHGLAKNVETLSIDMANRLRNVGLKLLEAAGHEQVIFDWWHRNEENLPGGLNFKAAKVCVHLARSSEQPFKEYAEVRKAQQMFFEALGDVAAPKRLVEQTAHAVNPWNDLVNEVASLTGLFGRLDSEPMNAWPREKLETFVRTTKPVADRYQEAAALLGGGKA